MFFFCFCWFHSTILFFSIPVFAAKGESRLQDEVTRTSAFSVFKMVSCWGRNVLLWRSWHLQLLTAFWRLQKKALEGRETLAGSATVATFSYLSNVSLEIPRAKWSWMDYRKTKGFTKLHTNWPIGDSRNVVSFLRKTTKIASRL